MNKINGIITSKDGRYIRASLVKMESGWKLSSSASWNSDAPLKKILLLSRGIHLGIECKWINVRYTEQNSCTTASGDTPFTACIPPGHLQHHSDVLNENLLGIYPEDLYLCTIPLYILNDCESSFISVYKEDQCFKIGIILKRKLSVVFSVPATTDVPLQSFIGRLERYWSTLDTCNPFPNTAYTFNNQDINPGEHFKVQSITTPDNDHSIIKATGVAFCEIDNTQPSFSGPSEASGFRLFRSAIYVCSALFLLVSIILSGTFFILDTKQNSELSRCESEYKNILISNNEIRDMLKNGNELAAKLKRIHAISGNPTQWSKFLHLIGNERPSKLYFERFASEQVKNSESKVRIALTGWAEGEMIVTDMIKKLNSSEIVTNATLSSLERDDKQKSLCRFKILCILNLSKN